MSENIKGIANISGFGGGYYVGSAGHLEARSDKISNQLTTVNKDSMVAIREIRSDEGKAARRQALRQGKDHAPFRSKLITAREDGKANCLTTANHIESLISDGFRIRQLTPTERERLQGYPDGWTAGQPETLRIRQTGNAVSPPVIKAIAARMGEIL